MTPLRIAVTGSAGTGKTTLARMLAERLGLPLVAEETRAWLEGGGPCLSSLPPARAREVLSELWRRRQAAERAHPRGFVADNCSLDFAAYALHHGCAAEGDAGSAALLAEASAHLASYDAVLVLPWGAIPYALDGVRSPEPALELRYQLVLEGLLRRDGNPERVHAAAAGPASPAARLAWALEVAGRARPGSGWVALVGAGPGDPGLLTVRARALLACCDVVAYDELVPPALLALVRPGAERLAVGRRCHGRRAPMRLHPDVLERALAGKRVVRLKAGDPFVFGRGGEEAEDLARAGVAFEVVPGISAALGAAAAAWIPLTHRELSSDVTFATGHDLTHAALPARSAWAALAPGGTLVLYMASRSLARNLSRLVAHGRSPTTPAAWIAAATRPEQQVVVGTVGDLASRVGEQGDAPALVIVGEVVRVRERLQALVQAGRAA
ncbi:MAG: uroporphyrinogen-III C-methyltransferase [Anaeromyxobacter sp.]